MPGFRHTYATYQDMVGRARMWVLGLKIRILKRSVGSNPTAPTARSKRADPTYRVQASERRSHEQRRHLRRTG